MALPQPAPRPLPASDPTPERPPQGGWYWNTNRLARAWLPLIGPEGLGLLDFYLALADHRPGAPAPGWTAITLDELTRLTGWGRARLVRQHRLLVAAGLLEVRYLPVPGRGPAVQRALYRVQRAAAPPSAETLARLASLADDDPTLAARLRRYTTTAPPPAAPPARPAPPAPAPAPVPLATPVPVSSENRSEESPNTEQPTTTSARARVDESLVANEDERAALTAWRAANGRDASCLERQRLGQLALQVASAAHADGVTGWAWVAAAIAEAVEAGSAYVAPRRLARILARWQAEGRPDQAPPAVSRPRAAPPPVAADRLTPTPAPPISPARDATPPAAEPAVVEPAVTVLASPPTPPAPATPTARGWTPPPTLPGLPASPAAILRAAQAAAGLAADPYLRGAALAGWTADGGLAIATATAVPAAPAARLLPRLARGLASVVGRPVALRLVAWAAVDAAAGVE